MGIFFNYNGDFYKEGSAVIKPSNPGFKYGDGLFETMKMIEGKIIFSKDHFERLFYGMEVLQLNIPFNFTQPRLEEKILELAKKNNHTKNARIRLMVFRGDGKLTNSNNTPEYIIQTSEMPISSGFNTYGLNIDIYSHAKKSCDLLANIKTNNYLPYIMASIHAKKNNLDDCVLLNSNEKLCDTSIANIFIIKDANIYTPALREGCVAGIIRKRLLQLKNYSIIETAITIDELENADEVFLSNSIFDMRWVKQFRDVEYKNTLTQKIYHLFTQTF